MSDTSILHDLIAKNQTQLLAEWVAAQQQMDVTARLKDDQLEGNSNAFLGEVLKGVAASNYSDVHAESWGSARNFLEQLSRSRARQGFTPAETATFIFSLKEPLFKALSAAIGNDAKKLQTELWSMNVLLDKLGLYTTQVAQKAREEIITRQQEELIELSTPVVVLWEGILALPLIGTLDSSRTQVIMENLLERIVSAEAEIAIIDITGVPTVDTLVAQHLIKTISAARLMGADCIISGIRPQIAQTMVHLGVELNVISKANMADAFALALRKTGRAVVKQAAPVKQAALAKE
ncbi:MAG: STAS domain-containing protein [Steroidobacteraceae bacterium]